MDARHQYLEELRRFHQERLKELEVEEAAGTRQSADIAAKRAQFQAGLTDLEKQLGGVPRQRDSWWRRTWSNPYQTLGPPAHSIKALLQIAVGIWLLLQIIYALWRAGGDFSLARPLTIVGEGLLLTTAIELAYLLYTRGPDEAIDPLLTGIAAVFLMRAPTPLDTITYPRIAELAVYGVVLAILLGVRRPFLSGVREEQQGGERSQPPNKES